MSLPAWTVIVDQNLCIKHGLTPAHSAVYERMRYIETLANISGGFYDTPFGKHYYLDKETTLILLPVFIGNSEELIEIVNDLRSKDLIHLAIPSSRRISTDDIIYFQLR